MIKEFKITKNDEGQRIDRFLKKEFKDFPLSLIYKLFRKKEVKINNKPAKKEQILKIGDNIKVFLGKLAVNEQKPDLKKPDFKAIFGSNFYKKNFKIIFEDDFLLVVNKPAGLAVHPGSGTKFGQNLIDLACAYVLANNSDTPEPRLAHRLDKDTSGLVIICKNNSALRKVTALLRGDGVKKIYYTAVKGKLKEKSGIITDKILRDHSGVRVSTKREAKTAITKYKLVKEFADFSLLEVEIQTGRTHQIRVHFANLGHPVLMDSQHGDFEWNKTMRKKTGLKRQFLHAKKLEFVHPETEKKIVLEAELGEDLLSLLK